MGDRRQCRRRFGRSALLLLAAVAAGSARAQRIAVTVDQPLKAGDFALADRGLLPPLVVADQDASPVRMAAQAFAGDLQAVTGVAVPVLHDTDALHADDVVLAGTLGRSPVLDRLIATRGIDVSAVKGKWEAALVRVVDQPLPGVKKALVIAGSDPRGVAFALFEISRQMGVSPWTWWADVPVRHHRTLGIGAGVYVQPSPSVAYRGIFLNDEDWGLRPWAAKKMDPEVHNIGPHTYARLFELLLRLHANTLWPAMHPGTTAFHAIPENATLADQWGIVMGSSHSEAMTRNNVGEYDETRNGPWNYQTNRPTIFAYWDQGLVANGRYENFYTVGMRGVHDSGLEATGTPEQKARLVEQVMSDQRNILANRIGPDLAKIPQVIWLYKESIDLYRAGMQVPPDVTLGWTDDNYGYLRQLPNAQERARPGGSALYYHVSYWGRPHDYLWLATTPPALMQEELSKAFDHGVQRLWVLNVGDLKPAEIDMDYFLQMAWQEPATAALSQHAFLLQWFTEQFSAKEAPALTAAIEQFYRLSFIRKPEFMGFNGYDDGIQRTAFNPLAWGDQNRQRLADWQRLSDEVAALGRRLPAEQQAAFFELVGYPVEAAAAQNAKLLWNDRSFLDAHNGRERQRRDDLANTRGAYDRVQALTADYNALEGGKWDGMMSAHPRDRHVFDLPTGATSADGSQPLPATWGTALPAADGGTGTGLHEVQRTVSIEATHFNAKHDGADGAWKLLPELGLAGGSVTLGAPGLAHEAAWVTAANPPAALAAADAPWLQYRFTTTSPDADATLQVFLLPAFPLDSSHRLRYAVSVDGAAPVMLDAAGAEGHTAGLSGWESNVLRNAAIQTLPLGRLAPGTHTLRLFYGDPGLVFEHLVIAFPGAPPAYPFPPETGASPAKRP